MVLRYNRTCCYEERCRARAESFHRCFTRYIYTCRHFIFASACKCKKANASSENENLCSSAVPIFPLSSSFPSQRFIHLSRDTSCLTFHHFFFIIIFCYNNKIVINIYFFYSYAFFHVHSKSYTCRVIFTWYWI